MTGPRGSTGDNGSDGPVGGEGPVGRTGATGAKGHAGGKGPVGHAGATGAAGATGPTGGNGGVGANGAAGAAGATGGAGSTGAKGSTGAGGAGGAAGGVGAVGPTGDVGATGPTGPAGTCPSGAIDSLLSELSAFETKVGEESHRGVGAQWLLVTRTANVCGSNRGNAPNQKRNLVYFDTVERACPAQANGRPASITYNQNLNLFNITRPGIYMLDASMEAGFVGNSMAKKVVDFGWLNAQSLSNPTLLQTLATRATVAEDGLPHRPYLSYRLTVSSASVPLYVQLGFLPANDFPKFDEFATGWARIALVAKL